MKFSEWNVFSQLQAFCKDKVTRILLPCTKIPNRLISLILLRYSIRVLPGIKKMHSSKFNQERLSIPSRIYAIISILYFWLSKSLQGDLELMKCDIFKGCLNNSLTSQDKTLQNYLNGILNMKYFQGGIIYFYFIEMLLGLSYHHTAT